MLSAYDPAAGISTLTFRVYMVVAAIGTVLAAGYLLWMFQRVAMGKVKTEFENAHVHDVHWPEWIAWTPLLILIVVLGVYPNLIFRITDGAASNLAQGMARALG
jgi:NADH-quinone oxidoreductase subunit M